MLGEWLTHITTPCPQPYRRMGYLKELIAIERRYRRCRSTWVSHLENCQNLIIGAAGSCTNKGKAVVLGSGLLLDIPLPYLAQNFDHVVLVDICHLRSTIRTAQEFPNVRLMTADIGGVVTPLDKWHRENRHPPLPTPDIKRELVSDANYVVSSNLLSQLPLTPLNFLEKKHCEINDQDKKAFARNIIDHHLSLLQSLDCPVTLITETLRLISSAEKALNKTDPLFGAPLLYEGEEWWWDVAPRPEIDKQFDLRLAIRGIANLNDAAHVRFCRNTTLAAP